MSEAYRQKLLNWWCSIALIGLASVSSTTAFLLAGYNNPVLSEGDQAFRLFGGLGISFDTFLLLVVPAMSWHLCDACERKIESSHFFDFFGHYTPFAALSAVNSVLLTLVASSVLTSERCPDLDVDPNRAGFVSCVLGPPQWLQFSSLTLLLLLLILCIGKAVISIRSRLQKAP